MCNALTMSALIPHDDTQPMKRFVDSICENMTVHAEVSEGKDVQTEMFRNKMHFFKLRTFFEDNLSKVCFISD